MRHHIGNATAGGRRPRDTGGMTDEPTFWQQLAEICRAAAEIVLDPIAPPAEADVDPEPRWAYERRVWAQEGGTEEPMNPS